MESWRKVWRDGFAPQLDDDELRALLCALDGDLPQLVQGRTAIPLPGQPYWPQTQECAGACPVGYPGWKVLGLLTTADVEEKFAQRCHEADTLLGEPVACRYFLNWWDETDREEARRLLAGEVRRELDIRAETVTAGR